MFHDISQANSLFVEIEKYKVYDRDKNTEAAEGLITALKTKDFDFSLPFIQGRRIKKIPRTKVMSSATKPFAMGVALDDGTEIVHSEMREDGRVKVYLEKPDAKDGFHHATCYLPGYDWEDVFGFTEEEMKRYQEVIESTAHLILEFSQEGGFENASSF